MVGLDWRTGQTVLLTLVRNGQNLSILDVGMMKNHENGGPPKAPIFFGHTKRSKSRVEDTADDSKPWLLSLQDLVPSSAQNIWLHGPAETDSCSFKTSEVAGVPGCDEVGRWEVSQNGRYTRIDE